MPQTPSRRDFLRTTTAAAAGLALAAPARATVAPLAGFGRAKSCIFINMVGGPAHLDTFDPKPDAPSDVRGPFAPIQTNVPSVRVSELFPKLAAHADKFALVRSMHHDAPPVHECGFQLLNTGRLFRDGPEWPSAGAVVTHLLHSGATYTIIPTLDVSTGVNVSHGFASAGLGREPVIWEGGGSGGLPPASCARQSAWSGHATALRHRRHHRRRPSSQLRPARARAA
jgi:hypothetical protein